MIVCITNLNKSRLKILDLPISENVRKLSMHVFRMLILGYLFLDFLHVFFGFIKQDISPFLANYITLIGGCSLG
jgi:hypothetical protein